MNNVTVNETDVVVQVVPDEITVTITDSVGIPAGGTANQVLKKNSSTDYDVSWASDVAGVPYTGATQDVNLGEFGLLTGNLEFDTTPTNAPTGAGSMVWNDTEGTLDLTLKGASINLPIGQKQVIRAVNGTGGNLTRAQYRAVKITGAQGQRLQVSLARADNDANSKDTIGIVGEDISNNQTGFIVSSGLIEEINTTGSLQSETWADGDTLYLSGTTYGVITNIKPAAPIHTVILGFVVYAHANHGKIYVKVDNGYELTELHDVNTLTAASGDYLRYNGTTWVDATISAADLPSAIDASKIGSGLVSNAEFGYLDGVTSAIQTQLNAKQATLTLTTTGTSGAATLVGATLNIPQYQAVLTNPVTGTGTTNRLAKFTGSSTIGDGGIVDLRTTEGMRLTAAGDLLINSTSDAYAAANRNIISLNGTTDNLISLRINGDYAAYIFTNATSIDINGNNRAVTFSTNGAEKARIFNNGNYIIGGTADAGYKLDIQGTLRNTTSAYFATSSGNVGVGTTAPTNKLMVIAGNSSGFNLSYDTSGNNRTGIFAWTNASSGGGIGGGVEQTTDFVFTARSTSASSVNFGGGNISFNANTGLTAGSTYTQTARMLIWGSGNISVGNTSDAGYRFDITGDIRNTTSAYFATSSGGVGIGTTTAAASLHVYSPSSSEVARFAYNGNAPYISFWNATDRNGYIQFDASGGMLFVNQKNTAAIFHTNNTERMRITADGNFGFGQTTFGTSATKTLAIGSGTAPTTSPADAFQLYSADITAGNAAPHFRTEGGAVVKLYQQTTGVGAATFVANTGTAVNDASTFDGYTLNQIVKALRNAGFLA